MDLQTPRMIAVEILYLHLTHENETVEDEV